MDLRANYILISLFVLLFFFGCKENHEKKIYKQILNYGLAEEQYEYSQKIQNNEVEGFSSEDMFKLLLKAAEQDHAQAQFAVGECYYEGSGVRTDYEQAFIWYQKAADKGLIEADTEIARSYMYGRGVKKDVIKAIKWYKKAASKGEIIAQNSLGRIYYEGIDDRIPIDYDESFKWYFMAADQGDRKSQFIIGKSYYYGEGLSRDREEAVKWLTLSAESNSYEAQFLLGRCYAFGQGVPQDFEQAYFWLYLDSPDEVVYSDDYEYDCTDYLFVEVIASELSLDKRAEIEKRAFQWIEEYYESIGVNYMLK